jgi:hypothetical protein
VRDADCYVLFKPRLEPAGCRTDSRCSRLNRESVKGIAVVVVQGRPQLYVHGQIRIRQEVFVPRRVFVSFAVIDVCSRGVAAHQPPLFVAKRVVTEQKPAILAILPQSSLFDFKRQPRCQIHPTLFTQSFQIFRVRRIFGFHPKQDPRSWDSWFLDAVDRPPSQSVLYRQKPHIHNGKQT